MGFEGFPRETLTFLRELRSHNDRDWFHAHRGDYDDHVIEPAKAFVVAMQPKLTKLAPDVQAVPKIVGGSIQRINRDTRFSKDKTPYKDHLAFFFTLGEGRGRPGFYLHFTAEELVLGGGSYCFGDRLDRFRTLVDDPGSGELLGKIVTKLRKDGYDVGGEHYKRVPRGFDKEHPRADLLRHDGLYGGTTLAIPPEFHTKQLPAFCAKHYRKLLPVTEWVAAVLD